MSENYLEASEVFAMQEYYERTHDVKCLMCGGQLTGTQDELERLGWRLHRNGEFCPADLKYANPEITESNSESFIWNFLLDGQRTAQRGVAAR